MNRAPSRNPVTAVLFGAKLAMDTIRGHKLRSLLTILGVIIGTSTVIGVGSIIAGLDGAITGQLQSFGAENLIVTKWDSPLSFGVRLAGSRILPPSGCMGRWRPFVVGGICRQRSLPRRHARRRSLSAAHSARLRWQCCVCPHLRARSLPFGR